jgi:alkylhydroperoxidase family enzyme
MLGRALGFSENLIQAINEDYMATDELSPAEKAAVRWAEVVTLKQYQPAPGVASQSPEAMAALKKHFRDDEIVELTLAIGYFNFWNRFTDSLEIDLEDKSLREKFGKLTVIDPNDYKEFMNSCWWTESIEAK